jgi:two-component system cell cycle sensor histidine kinase/response regulator CckA
MAETVLLVEDDARVRRLAQRLFVKLGYNVIVAENGGAAVASCRGCRDPIELLLTDVFMPDVGGPELARRLAAIQPNMRVLYLSGSNEALPAEGLLAQGSNFLQKPFTAEEFGKKIREILDR